IMPWEHFAALKSYVAAIAETGILQMVTESFNSNDIDPEEMPFGFNAAMQKQIFFALDAVAPPASINPIVAKVLECLCNDELPRQWFESRLELFDETFSITKRIKSSSDIRAILTDILENVGTTYVPTRLQTELSRYPNIDQNSESL
ncbi:MAG TPA: hypothetical protein VKK79_01390, partial [Candidatus Lokiarchaeia archaeon]|nr:hypothetical protein [Candidatus Lokiarchaeia archaeon]